MIDTHAHIYSEKFEEDREGMIQRIFDSGVSQVLMPNVDSESIDGMLDLETNYPNKFLSMMGLHPCSVNDSYLDELAVVESWLKKRSFIAVGEIGLDFYWDRTFEKQQFIAFERQLELAKIYNLPVAIHMRDSIDETLEVLEKFHDVKGVLHCFSGNKEQAQKAIDLGFLLGIGGVVTFKKSTLPEAIKEVPLEYLLLETDSPYLSPAPNRGKRNEPSFLIHIANKIADIKEVSFDQVNVQTTENASLLFGLKTA